MSTVTPLTIWCLFSIENNYDQPLNNLERWWSEKPSIEKLASYLGYPLSTAKDEDVVKVVSVWQGQSVQIHLGSTSYRLQEVAEETSL
jgi:phosphoribosylamine-glycine ligase